MTTDYDVIIIGAGPAGASCAKHLVENGVKTLVVEKKKLPREKVCAALLVKRSADFLKSHYGKLPDDVLCKNTFQKTMTSYSGKHFVELKIPEFTNVFRDKFDYWLITKANVQVLNEEFVEIKNNNSLIEIKTKSNTFLKCKYLVGADGGLSRIRKMIDEERCPADMIGYQWEFDGNSDIKKDYCYTLSSNKYSDFFSWFFYKNEKLYLGTMLLKNNKNDVYFKNLMELITARFHFEGKLIKTSSIGGCILENKARYFLGKSNIILIGDSAGLFSGMGEGISHALYSGYYAAQSIIENKNNIDLYDVYKNKMSDELDIFLESWKISPFNKNIESRR